MIATVVTGVLLAIGGFFCVSGAVGLIRFPDVYARLHAAGVTDTGGVGFIFLGLMAWVALGDEGWGPALLAGDLDAAFAGLLLTFKLASIVFFLWISGTTATHAVAKAAWLEGVEPWQQGDDPPGGAS